MLLKMSIFAYNIVTSQFMFQFCFLLGDQNKKNKCSIVLINVNFTVQAVIEFIPYNLQSVAMLCPVAVCGHLTSTSMFPAARLL
ncbi:hypothetical protein ZEAMMB73_Zm00001d053532 [Zea mays]|uniref:Uncharacterized protein n=1 Tax=Zea mays TaxID=4577 RepID=A0A1D6QPY1_MAIZE|nr:hypothetical protein ZEAMMB73_Zm00001d053532 [Zea mays]AQK59589.1 hypothetical protein ZEAMMB73_Zm00001d053532 [Zea mays]